MGITDTKQQANYQQLNPERFEKSCSKINYKTVLVAHIDSLYIDSSSSKIEDENISYFAKLYLILQKRNRYRNAS